MFKYKTQEQVDKMSVEDANEYAVEKREYEAAQAQEAIKTALGPLQSELTEANKTISSLGEQVAILKEQTIFGAAKKNTLEDEILANKADLKAMANKTGSKEAIVLKSLVLRSAINGNTQAVELNTIGQLAHRKLSAYDLFPKIQISESNNNGTIHYRDWDQATTVRAAAAVAEGALFPESTATWKQYSVALAKIGDTIPVTEEFFEDELQFASELNFFLDTNVALELDRQIVLGTGAGNTMVGLVSSIPVYVPVSGSNITAPSRYDLIVKVAEDITFTGGSKYNPDFALMNIAEINRMKLTKDDVFNYVIPPFVNQDGSVVAGIRVYECNILSGNTMIVGDSRYAKIYEKAGIELSKGFVGTQFTEDELTLKARKRALLLLRNADASGFRYVSSISAALTVLGT